jgi:glycosyltransferase involved in cell wall biosynthesis
LLNTWHHAVDQYIALTEFARQKFIQGGLPAHKIIVKPNFIDPDPGVGRGDGNYALFIGRLSVEKGLDTLLEAWKHVGNALPLKIVGDGPLASQVSAATEKLPQVEWLGRMEPPELFQLLGAAKLLIFPSKWYETFGRVVVEAFACGTPVIASNLGAMAELMEHGHTGLLFETGNPEDLAAKVRWLLARPKLMAEMRQAARAEFEAKYTATANYHKLMAIYQPLVRLSSPRVPVILPSR